MRYMKLYKAKQRTTVRESEDEQVPDSRAHTWLEGVQIHIVGVETSMKTWSHQYRLLGSLAFVVSLK